MANDSNERRELGSWKEIGDFLGVDRRTAQRYEQKFGMPVHRVGGKKGGSVVADIEELEDWKRRTVLTARWWQDVRFLQRYALTSTLVICMLSFFAIRDLVSRLRTGQPHSSKWVDATLVVHDRDGREVWRRTFEHFPLPALSYQRYHGDLDGDGDHESLISFVPDRNQERLGGALYCFSSTGKQLWRLQPNRAVSDRKTTFSTLYTFRSFTVFPSPQRDGSSWVVAVFVHHYAYPSVAVILDGKGIQRGEYWHSGHMEGVHATDLDGDGKSEILLAATSLGLGRAVVRVLDPLKVDGAEMLPPGHPNQLQGFQAAKEKASILFGRSRLNRMKHSFNYAYYIVPATTADGSFQVFVSEELTREQGYLIYAIRHNLSLASITPAESLITTYREYSLKEPDLKPFGQEDLSDLRAGYTVVWGDSASTSAGNIPRNSLDK